MLETIREGLELVEPYWLFLFAILIPLCASWGGTQAIKSVWTMVRKHSNTYINSIYETALFRVLAVGICFYGVVQLWPAHGALWVAMSVAPFTLVIYAVVVKALYKKWPYLEGWISANPDLSVTVPKDKQ